MVSAGREGGEVEGRGDGVGLAGIIAAESGIGMSGETYSGCSTCGSSIVVDPILGKKVPIRLR